MGSGCTTNNTTNNLFQAPIPDTQVQYKGPSIPALNICTGDLLSEVEAVVLQRIVDYATGKNICIPNIDLTLCKLFASDTVSCCKTDCNQLDDLMVIIFNALCTLYGDFTSLQSLFDALNNGPYNIACLKNLGTNPTLSLIIQELITEFCALQAQVTALAASIPTTSQIQTIIGNFLSTAVNSCNTQLKKTGSGSSIQLTFSGFVPLGGIIPYAGPLTVFDSSGKGLPNTEACGWALANGLNGTVDMKGNVPVGTTNMGGNSLTSITSGATYNLNDTGGLIFAPLVNANIPALAFSGTTSSTTGSVPFYTVSRSHAGTGDNTMGYMCDGSGTSTPCPSAPNSSIPFTVPATSFSGTVGGSGLPHENRMPYRALYYIQRIA